MSEYNDLKNRLASGWNTWNTRSMVSHVLLPYGFALNVGIKDYWRPSYVKEALMGIKGPRDIACRPGWRSYDGTYTDVTVLWRDIQIRVESATVGDDLVLLITPLHDLKRHVVAVVETGVLWNRQGSLARDGEAVLARLPGREVNVVAATPTVPEPYVQTQTPYFAFPMSAPAALATGAPRSCEEISRLISKAREDSRGVMRQFGAAAESYEPIHTCIAWNTVYDPIKDRVITPVSRDWSTWDFGGYVLFGWDTFFAALLASVGNRDLAYANAIAMAHERTNAGFIPNWAGGTGCVTIDRSMPQVGGLVCREIYRRHREKWFLEEVFADLLSSNRWYAANRSIDGYICLGSNRFDPVVGTWEETNGVGQLLGAKFEFGLDNSHMYDGVPFDLARGLMLQADVGQMSLHIADCRAIADIADILGHDKDAAELRERADKATSRLQCLWDDDAGVFRNRSMQTGQLSQRISPTSFYPMLCGAATPEQARRLVQEHMYNPAEFWGEHVLPVTPRNDPAFSDQNYWRGKIWPPVNFLTYVALRCGGQFAAASDLAAKSRELLMREWTENRHVHENYSADSGKGCDRPDSDSFYQWGGLLGLMALIEAGHVAGPEKPLE